MVARLVEQDLQLWILIICWRDKKADWTCPVQSGVDSQLEPVVSSCTIFLSSFVLGDSLSKNWKETNKLERLLALVGRAAVEQPIVAEVNDLLKNLEDQLWLPCDAYKARALATELQ